jgi:hypothetical protein
LDAAVAAYVERKAKVDGVDLLTDLSALPAVEDPGKGRLRVRFRSRPGTRRWKDWLVEFTNGASQIDGLELEGFFDKVGGALRSDTPG